MLSELGLSADGQETRESLGSPFHCRFAKGDKSACLGLVNIHSSVVIREEQKETYPAEEISLVFSKISAERVAQNSANGILAQTLGEKEKKGVMSKGMM